MSKSARNNTFRKPLFPAKGKEASTLRRRKHQLARRFGLPSELVGGSLNEVFRRCGKASCHCVASDGHPMWTLTYSVQGRPHVEFVPQDLVATITPLVERGAEYRDAVNELRAINAQLITLGRKQRKATAKKTKKGHR